MKELFQVPSSKFKVQGSKSRNLEPGTWNLEHAAAAWALGTVLIAAMLLFPFAVSAQKLVIDPTRPPVGLGAGAAETESDTAGGIRLQSVMISPTQSAAIINGVRVRLGEKYGDAVLVRVAESEVVLKSGGAQQVLKIHPGVEKRDIVPVALAAPAAVKSAPRKAKAKARRDAKPAADADAPVRQGARP
jgi:MSHA biogenesis protein MshK